MDMYNRDFGSFQSGLLNLHEMDLCLACFHYA